jgi:hypothetical protein
MADPLDCPGYQRFIYIIRIILDTNAPAKESVWIYYDRRNEMETNDKLAQQGLAVVSGDKVPQETRLCNLHLRAIVRANDETGIVWGEQMLPDHSTIG